MVPGEAPPPGPGSPRGSALAEAVAARKQRAFARRKVGRRRAPGAAARPRPRPAAGAAGGSSCPRVEGRGRAFPRGGRGGPRRGSVCRPGGRRGVPGRIGSAGDGWRLRCVSGLFPVRQSKGGAGRSPVSRRRRGRAVAVLPAGVRRALWHPPACGPAARRGHRAAGRAGRCRAAGRTGGKAGGCRSEPLGRPGVHRQRRQPQRALP